MNKDLQIRKAIVVLSIGGLLDAIYLALIKFTANPAMCIQGVGDCWGVNNSSYSEILGIPVSLFGAAAYIALIALAIFQNRIAFIKPYANLLFFGMTLMGVLFSAYLTYVEFWVLKAVCPFCIVSAILMVCLFALSIYKLANAKASES